MSSDFLENKCVHAKNVDRCDDKLATLFGQLQTEQKVYGSPAQGVNARPAVAEIRSTLLSTLAKFAELT
jgi:hypothetical protein